MFIYQLIFENRNLQDFFIVAERSILRYHQRADRFRHDRRQARERKIQNDRRSEEGREPACQERSNFQRSAFAGLKLESEFDDLLIGASQRNHKLCFESARQR